MKELVLKAEATLSKGEITILAGKVEELIDDCIYDISSLSMNGLTRASKEALLKAIFDEILGSEEK